ncbi:MAG: universal stress protein [Candidatus Bathyarchaeota archaeon]
MFKKILIPIDGSEQSHRALTFALDLAKKYSSKVTLLTVAQPHFQDPLFPPIFTSNDDNSINDVHQKILSQAYNRIKEIDSEIEVSKKLVAGRPADKIIEITKKDKIDLVVIGSRGLGGIKEFLLGSVSDRVADHAPCPVLMVKKCINIS